MNHRYSIRPARPDLHRRGNIAVLAALMAMLLLGMVAFTVDVGYVLSSQQELQRTADATALAACWTYGDKRGQEVPWQDAMATSRLAAADYAAVNVVGNHATDIDLNSSNDLSGDLVFGYMDDLWDPNCTQQTSSAPFFNSVKVRIRRDDGYNGKVPYFFARVFGATGQDIDAEATAGFLRNVGGFKIPYDNSNIGILPFALDIETWEAMLNDGIGEDDFYWDEETKTLTEGQDGRLEINLFPQGLNAPGNRGTLDIGSANNSTDDIARQVLHGVTPADLAYHGGKLEFIPDPDEMIQKTLDHIDKKRADLGLSEYNPERFGRSGDARMVELEDLPLSVRREAIYGVAAD